MSLFNWFTKGKKPQRATRSKETETDLSYATVPSGGLPGERSRSTPSGTGSTQENQAARHLRREQLYGVIRHEMLKAGVLTSAYKFKVLSLDSRGVSYLVMLELPELLHGGVAQLTACEHAISLQAKSQYGVVVTAVFWRVNESIPRQAQASVQPSAYMPLQDKVAEPQKHALEPVSRHEMDAFKQALAKAPRVAALANPGQILPTGKQSPMAPADFDRHAEVRDYQSVLGVSQYGTL